MGVAKAALEGIGPLSGERWGLKGVRVNAVSPGPAMTLSARGIPGFTDFYKELAAKAPLRRTTVDEVGDTALFLVSNLSRGVTGETLYVDNGLHILG